MANVFKTLCKHAKEKGLPEPTVEVKMIGYEAKVRIGNKKWTSKPLYSSGKAIADASRKALMENGFTEITEVPSSNANKNGLTPKTDTANNSPQANEPSSPAASSDFRAEFEQLRQFQQLNS